MKIAIVTDNYSKTSSKRGVRFQSIEYISRSLEMKGHQVELFCWLESDYILRRIDAEETSLTDSYHDLVNHNLKVLYGFDLVHNFSMRFLMECVEQLVSLPIITTITEYCSGYERRILRIEESSINNRFIYSSAELAIKYKVFPDSSNVITAGIDMVAWPFNNAPLQDFLLYYNEIHKNCGLQQAIDVAKKWNKKLIISGKIRCSEYFESVVLPQLDKFKIKYIGDLDDQKLSHYLQNVIGLINTSYNDNDATLTIAKSLASGTPVISINTDISAKLLGAKNGIILKGEKVIEQLPDFSRLLNISRESCRMGALARFNNIDMLNSYTLLYQDVLNNNSVNLKPAS